LKGFKVSLREVVYGVEWVTVRLPVLYRGEGEDEGGGVAQGGETLDTAISRSRIKVARQTCLVHLKRSRRVRDTLDLLLSLYAN